MEKKFTPGNWSTDGHFLIAGDATIAEFYNNESFVPKPGTTIPTVEQSKVNLKLAAAAPELLEALEMAMYEVKDWHEYNYNQIDSFDDRERAMQVDVANSIYEKLQKIRSVITKATT